MKILIIAATEAEVRPFLQSHLQKTKKYDVLITQAGMVATTYSLTKTVKENNYDLLLNVGIAGAFSKNTKMGEVVRIKKDCFSELGAQDGEQFLSIEDLNLGQSQYHEALPAILQEHTSISQLKTVKGITVNRVHGQDSSIQRIINRLSPDVESMEGAAVFYVAQQEKIPAIQVRAISNLVEKRNKENWNIPLAITNLNNWIINFLSSISQN